MFEDVHILSVNKSFQINRLNMDSFLVSMVIEPSSSYIYVFVNTNIQEGINSDHFMLSSLFSITVH